MEKAEKKARAKGAEKREGTPLEDFYRVDVDQPEVVQHRAATAQPSENVALGSAAPGSDLSHDQFWAPVIAQGKGTQESRPSDVSSLFHLSVVDKKLQQDLQALGAHNVSEILSPPRFTDKCHSFGLLPGYAIDHETGWSLLEKTQKLSLLRSLEEEDPYVVTGSPPCGPFSALQGLNEGRVDPVKRQQRQKLLKIACGFYEKQIERGRYFLHGHPSSARSWQEDCIKRIAQKPNVYVVEGPMCRWKMMGRDASGIWDHVDRQFALGQIYGPEAAALIRRGAARAAVQEATYGIALQAALVGALNGASVALFPGVSSPVSLFVMIPNPAQTRKSQSNQVMEKVGKAVDEWTAERVGKPVKTSVLRSFSDAGFWSHCSSEWDQLGGGEGRAHWSMLVCLNESYRLLRMLGALGSKQSCDKDGPCDGSAQWNRLLQTGSAELTCKTAGAGYGGVRPVGIAGLGNLHVGTLQSMLRQEAGNHEAAPLERVLFLTGRPVSPHAALPESLEVRPGMDRVVWALGLPMGALTEVEAKELFEQDASTAWYKIMLADGTETFLRFIEEAGVPWM